MYAGRLVEEAPVRELFLDPRHPYTRGLLRSTPGAGPAPAGRRLPTLPGAVPDAASPPPGCRFHPRCPEAFAPCPHQDPALVAHGPDRRVACLLGRVAS
jgi:peptide/nickel transport system ATP-binding protein